MDTQEFSAQLPSFESLISSLPECKLGEHLSTQLTRCRDSLNKSAGRPHTLPLLEAAVRDLQEIEAWLECASLAAVLPEGKAADELSRTVEFRRTLSAELDSLRLAPITPGPPAPSNVKGFKGLDHFAVAVPSTSDALKLWRDTFGLKVLCSELVNQDTVRLTHLDLGNTQLQLVEPVVPNHPLHDWLSQNGPGLHHFCMKVDDIDEAMRASPVPTAPKAHQGTGGKRALFLSSDHTQGLVVEFTGK